MSVHLQREIERLKKQLLAICGLVEEQVQMSVRALVERDDQLAHQVERNDLEIDHREVEVEEECLKVLALYQPVAIDLRFIVSALKINNDLERIGDMAVNIARKAVNLAAAPPMAMPFDIAEMGEKTQTMLRQSIDALVNMDARAAAAVCASDDAVDQMKRDIRRRAVEMLKQDSSHADTLLGILAATRNLERIADLATNISEDIIYMVDGRIIRHGGR